MDCVLFNSPAIYLKSNTSSKYEWNDYFKGINRDECVAPIPGRPCFTGLLEIQSVSVSNPHWPPHRMAFVSIQKPRHVYRLDLLRDTELSKIEPHHLRLDLDLIELLPAVDTDDAANHFRHDDHVPQVRLDEIGLLVRLGFLLGLSQLLDQAHRLAFETTIESAAGTGMDDIAELF